ncbi:hypothetical protein BDQ12DRAFT_594313 [Crucibulum laeve]|uniref:SEC7 domain-containing protein n=1 Tax=Crucibulum laeve TaxID=68775 RepID=A0A5C3MHX9_9AGAR|nr:hypothetical protein BDQ12DRAFT_594313 [Crucibulum laeve]
MVDREQQPSRAEQRMLAVAKLKRAASLPRMKDGRRPPMHVEAVSEGEKAASEGEKSQNEEERKDDDESPPPELQRDTMDAEVDDADVEERATSPRPTSRNKRRSRSRSRSRTSKDFKGKARATQSPTPSPLNPGDSSPDEGPPPPPPQLSIPVPQLLSPVPSHFPLSSRLLRSPTPGSPEPSFFHPGTSPSTPIQLPTLEALQKGLFRSNSAGNTSAGRRMAMHKLTGGTETYEPSPSPTPPPLPGKLGRNNTVSGGERSAARELMLSRLGGRITKETDPEQVSGEERPAPSPTPKRRRRRSRRGSQSNPTVSDSDFVSTSPNTPLVPPTPLPPSRLDNYVDVRAQSATPNQASSSRNQSNERVVDSPPTMPSRQPEVDHERPEPARRRSVVVEDDEEDRYPTQPRHPGLPGTPPNRFPPHIAALRAPHTSDAPSATSTDSASVSPSAVGVPVYLSQRTPSRNQQFPSSPFTTPLKEIPISDDDEEQVLYPADSYRSRTPYGASVDSYDREISWVAEPVPIINDEDDDDEDDEGMAGEAQQVDSEGQYDEQDYEDPPLSATSSNGFSPQEVYDDTSPRVSSSSKSLIVESETSPDNTPLYNIPPSPSSVAALSQTTSLTRASDGSLSPQIYPTRLSIASRIQSPLNGETSDWDDRVISSESSKRAETASPTTWEKVKNTFSRAGSSSGRRSRTNSFANRDRRDHTDSSISRESGVSLTSGKTDKGELIGTFAQQQQQQAQPSLMQSPSASASILSLSPYAPPRGGASPIPPPSSADLSKYKDAKLFPFPGMKKLEEERNRAKGLPAASSSTPDVTALAGMMDDSQPPLSANSLGNGSLEIGRERKLSHQASDTRLIGKYATEPTLNAPSSDYFNVPSSTSQSVLKLPMTLPGVKQWLSKNNKKPIASPGTSPSSSIAATPPAVEPQASSYTSKKPSLSDLLRRKETEYGTDWEEIGSTPTTTSGDTLLGKKLTTPEHSPIPDALDRLREDLPSNGTANARSDHTDTEKTPKAKKTMPLDFSNGDRSYLSFDDSPSNLPSIPDPLLSPTPDLSSSLSDYPAHSTSESSSTTSSQYSLIGAPQGSVILDRLDEGLGPRRSTLTPFIDDPPRKQILSSPVLQVVNPNIVKDRFLFLFTDLLIIAKPVLQDQDNLMDTYKPSPSDRKFVVKSVVQLRNLRLSPDTDPQGQAKASVPRRNPLIKLFIQQFTDNPDHAISTLLVKSDLPEDPALIGQLLFRTLDLDRVRLGEYLARRTSRSVLKAYLDGFGFVGLRIDKALRVFLLSVSVPSKLALEHLLETFAGRWYEANARIVTYDRDLANRLVRLIVQLNEILHGGIAQYPGSTGYHLQHVTLRDFIDACKKIDTRHSLSDEFLEDVYGSIQQERLSQAPVTSNDVDLSITFKRPVPSRLTYKVQSEPIILRIPQADPNFTIQLLGQDLTFDPPILNFAKSPEVSFRITGTSFGPKTMVMRRSGPNAWKYSGLPLSHSIAVERAFMRHTFQLAFLDHTGAKRRYMFSVDDPLIRHQWSVYLKRQITKVNERDAVIVPSSPQASKIFRASEKVAFKILQEVLIGPFASPVETALSRLNGSSHHHSHSARNEMRGSHSFRTSPFHVRSKSRSKVYLRDRDELELGFGTLAGKPRDDTENKDDDDHPNGVEGLVWSGRDLELHCQQNSLIPRVLTHLQAIDGS